MDERFDPLSQGKVWPNHLAAMIQEARVNRGLTLEDLAVQAGLGRNREKITTILRGNWPRYATLVKVIGVLNISLEQVYPLLEKPTVGTLLETMRLRHGLTLNAAGFAVGISGSQVRRIERNLSPNSPSIAALRSYYGVESVQVFENNQSSLLANKLDDIMQERGFSLAEAARESDLDQMTILMILRGHKPSLYTMQKLEIAFGLTMDLAQSFDPNSNLAQQLKIRKWYSGLKGNEFADELGLSESVYTAIVVNSVIGGKIQGLLAKSLVVTAAAVQEAKSRYVQRVMNQTGRSISVTTLLGKYINEQCVTLGFLPGNVARSIGIHPSQFRKIRRGQLPRRWDRVEKIMSALSFSEQQRINIREEWEKKFDRHNSM